MLFLYRDISKQYISDATNDRDNLVNHCGKIKVYIVRELQFQHKHIPVYFFPMPLYAKNIHFKCSLYGLNLYRSVIEIMYTNTFCIERDINQK